MEKDNIEKIDEQIKDIMDSEKSKESTRQIIIDRKYAYDDIDDENTKRIDNINEIEDTDDKEEYEVEEESEDKEEDEVEEESEDKEDSNSTVEEKIEKNEEAKDTKKKNNKTIIWVLVCLIIILLIVLILLIPSPKKEKEEVKEKKELSSSEQKKIITGYGDALKGIIAVYYDKQNVLLEYNDAVKLVNYDYKVKCDEHEIYDDGEIYLNKCSIDGKKISYSYGKKQEKEELVVTDKDIFVYVSKTSGIATLNKPNNVKDYDSYKFQIDGAYNDLTLLDSANSDYVFYADENYNIHMLNFKTGKKVLDPLNYSSILPIYYNGNYDGSYIAVLINNKWGIYNINTRERVVGHYYDSVSLTLSMGISGPAMRVDCLDSGVIAVANYGHNGENSEFGVINYRDNTEIIPVEYKQMLKSGNYLWVVDQYDEGHIFDNEGEEYLADKYDKVYGIVNGKYILVNDGTNVKMVTIKGKELYDYGELELNNANFALTHKDGALFQFDNPNKDSNDNNTDCLEVIYDNSSKTGEVKTTYCGGIAKPILYLYPKSTQNVTVSFEHPEYLKTTYPKFVDNWKVEAHHNGDLYDEKGKYYYGLYWDEVKVHSVDFSTGYYVTKDKAIAFLEEKLDYIGLSPREANEFIMYWLPILEDNEQSLVYFELTEERESYNKLNINPKPDSLLRLVIHIKKVDQKVEIKKQSLTKFKRKGFVAVEWGGTTY